MAEEDSASRPDWRDRMLCGLPEKRSKILVTAALILTVAGCGQSATDQGSGPFGLNPRAKIKDLAIDPKQNDSAVGLYVLTKVPKPTAGIGIYAVRAFDQTGLCEIRSQSKIMGPDPSGAVVRAAIDKVAASLEPTYGKAKKFDSCEGGDICKDEGWATAVKFGARNYAYSWPQPKPTSGGVRFIALGVQTDENSAPYFRLDFELGDKAACDKAKEAAGVTRQGPGS